MSSGFLGFLLVLLLSVGPGGVFVVGAAGAEAAMQVADEAVAESSEGSVVEVAGGPALVVEVPAAGAGLEGAEGPLVDGVVEAPVADVAGQHGFLLAGCDGDG